jgi:hypothetical protein
MSEELVLGMRAGRAGFRDVSPVSSRARPRRCRVGGDDVVEHGAVDDVGQASFDAAHSFVRRLACCDLPVVAPLASMRGSPGAKA